MEESIEFKAFKRLEEKKKLATLLNANICPDCGDGNLMPVQYGSAFGPVHYKCDGLHNNKEIIKESCGYSIVDSCRARAIKEGKKLEV